MAVGLTKRMPSIESLGECRYISRLPHMAGDGAKFKIDSEQIVCDDTVGRESDPGISQTGRLTFEVAGPRERISFDPTKTPAAIVTCGGLCPGVNDVIRGLVMELWHGYRVTEILGIRYGYEGLVLRHGH